MRSRTFLFARSWSFLLLAAVAGCGHAPPPVVAPESVGLAGPELGRIHGLLDDLVKQGRIAGGVALVERHGKIAYLDPVGSQDRETGRPMTADTLFRICSMTKPITSVAIMMLVEEGKIALGDPLSKFVPTFKNATVAVLDEESPEKERTWKTVPATREVTVRDLLTHTSGIAYGWGPRHVADLYRKAGVSDGLVETPWTTAENADRIAAAPLLFQPGTGWEYGLSVDVLGRVVEVASGRTLEQFFAERIFAPLGMHDTFFHVPPDKQARLATVYRQLPDMHIERQPDGPLTRGQTIYSSTYPTASGHAFFSGGAGLVSSIRDYARFLRGLANGGELNGARILKRQTIAEMTRNQVGDLKAGFDAHGDRFGLGFGVVSEAGRNRGMGSVGTYSWGGFYFTYFWVDPQKDLIGIVMAQMYPHEHMKLWDDFRGATYRALRD